ncbi:MAG: Lrp/AsnC family transcriptional regulator [Ignisphaera sp.]
MQDIDEKDLSIINMLSRNARIPFTELAKHVNLSDVAVIKRIKKLENKVIKRYTIEVDPRTLAYKVVSITGIDVDPDKLFSIVDYLKVKDYVRGLWLATGDHALIAVIWAQDENEISYIHKEISSIEGVKRVCPAIILRTIKDVDMLFKLD